MSNSSGGYLAVIKVAGIGGGGVNAVTRMVRFWLGPEGYGPLIDAISRGEF